MPPHHHPHQQAQHQHHHPLESRSADLTSDNYPYVQLTTLNHEYLYPVIDEHQQHQHHKSERLDRSNSGGSLKKPDILVSQVLEQPSWNKR
jgi:sprouty-related EVH1 domain-containing protein